MMSHLKIGALAILAFLFAFTGVALAADAVNPDADPLSLARTVFDAFSGGHYAYMAALLVVLLVALVKRYLGGTVAWLHSDAGGSLMALLAATGAAAASALAAPGVLVTWALLKSALLVGVGAAGGYAVLKNLVVTPILIPLKGKLPVWAQPIVNLVLWVFDHGDQSPQGQAAVAGQNAVNAAPATGVNGAVGKPTDVK